MKGNPTIMVSIVDIDLNTKAFTTVGFANYLWIPQRYDPYEYLFFTAQYSAIL